MRKTFLLIPAFFLTAPSILQAKVISLQTETTIEARKNKLDATVTVTNRGDEPAENVEVQVEGDGFSLNSSAQRVLPPGQSRKATLSPGIQGALPGRYALLVRTLYSDANEHAFNALSTGYYSVGHNVPFVVLGTLDHIDISDAGQLTLRLKNLENREIDVHVRLFIPNELSSDSGSVQKALGPSEEAILTFPVHNFSATNNSTYPVYAVIEHDLGRTHYTMVASGLIRVIRKDLVEKYKYFLWFVLLSGLAALILFNARIFKTK